MSIHVPDHASRTTTKKRALPKQGVGCRLLFYSDFSPLLYPYNFHLMGLTSLRFGGHTGKGCTNKSTPSYWFLYNSLLFPHPLLFFPFSIIFWSQYWIWSSPGTMFPPIFPPQKQFSSADEGMRWRSFPSDWTVHLFDEIIENAPIKAELEKRVWVQEGWWGTGKHLNKNQVLKKNPQIFFQVQNWET